MEHPHHNLEKAILPGVGGGLVVTLFALLLANLLSQIALLACGGAELFRFGENGLEPYPFIMLALCSTTGFLAVSALMAILFRARVPLALRTRDLAPAAAGLVIVFFANMAGTAAGAWFGEEYTGAPDLGYGQAATIGVVLVAVLLAPAVEELFFREMLLTRVLAGAPRWLAIAATATAFGAFHLAAGGIALVLTLAVMGVVLAWLRLKTGSLAAPFLVHALNNAIALAFLS